VDFGMGRDGDALQKAVAANRRKRNARYLAALAGWNSLIAHEGSLTCPGIPAASILAVI
jgi:hypothetical protein